MGSFRFGEREMKRKVPEWLRSRRCRCPRRRAGWRGTRSSRTQGHRRTSPGRPTPRGPGAWRLFVTTLSNPKGLVIGLVLLPSQQNLAAAAGVFFAILLAVSAIWAGIGSTVAASGMAHRPALRRACACWLGTLSVWLAGLAFSG